MEKIQFSAPCLFGIEGICADELKRAGMENVRAENGKVLFEGDFTTLQGLIFVQDMLNGCIYSLQGSRRSALRIFFKVSGK